MELTENLVNLKIDGKWADNMMSGRVSGLDFPSEWVAPDMSYYDYVQTFSLIPQYSIFMEGSKGKYQFAGSNNGDCIYFLKLQI